MINAKDLITYGNHVKKLQEVERNYLNTLKCSPTHVLSITTESLQHHLLEASELGYNHITYPKVLPYNTCKLLLELGYSIYLNYCNIDPIMIVCWNKEEFNTNNLKEVKIWDGQVEVE